MRVMRVVIFLCFAAISGATFSGASPATDEEGSTGERTLLPERLYALIDSASGAANELRRPGTKLPCITRRADGATKQTALRLSMFIAELQFGAIPGSESLQQVKLPAWVFEPPACPTWQVIDRRNDWLADQVERVTDPICAKVRDKTGDSLACSVE